MCKTPGSIYLCEVHGSKLSFSVELPSQYEIGEDLAINLENFLHDALEKKLKFVQYSKTDAIALWLDKRIYTFVDLWMRGAIIPWLLSGWLLLYLNVSSDVLMAYAYAFLSIYPILALTVHWTYLRVKQIRLRVSQGD